jgi:hypothetical protein
MERVPSAAVLSNEAQIALLNQAADVKANMPVAAAEAKKTAQLITSTARRMLQFYRAFRRGDVVRAARELGLTPGTVHNTVLEYKYGWMPLLMEVKGAAEALAEMHFPRPPIFHVSRKAKGSSQRNRRLTGEYGWEGSGLSTVTQISDASRTLRHKVWFEVENRTHSMANQLGLTNPALVAWEVTPFSFVFDWFISVGDYLSALTACDGLKILWSMKSQLDVIEYGRIIDEPYRVVDGITCHAYTTNDKMKYRYYARGPFNLGTHSLFPPRNRDPFSWNRLVAGLALMKAQARRSDTIRV